MRPTKKAARGRAQGRNEGDVAVSCLCRNQLAALAAALKNLPVAMLAELLGPLRMTATGVSRLTLGASVLAGVRASATANAALHANAALAANFNLSAAAVARIEALASLAATMGLGPMNASATARLQVAATSMNAQMPSLQAMLAALLSPATAALAELLQLANSLAALQNLTGLNLQTPGIGAQFAACAAASASASAAANMSVAASARLSANMALALRLQAAARLMGIALAAPGGAMHLNAALGAAVALRPPAFPTAGLPSLLGQITALAQAKSVLGVDMLAKAAIAQLQAALSNLMTNVAAAVNASAAATAAASASASLAASASAMAQATAAANLSAVVSAAAALNANLVAGLPNLLNMSLAANLSAQLNLATGLPTLAPTPCQGCVFF